MTNARKVFVNRQINVDSPLPENVGDVQMSWYDMDSEREGCIYQGTTTGKTKETLDYFLKSDEWLKQPIEMVETTKSTFVIKGGSK